MEALDSLQRDHELLGGLAEAFEAYVDALEAGQPLQAGDLKELMQGFRALLDYRLFEKEEAVLVPVLVRSGFDYEHELLHQERAEQDGLRHLLAVLEHGAEREPSWSLDERLRIARAGRSLVERLRELAAQQGSRLVPELIERVGPRGLGHVNQQLCEIDARSARQAPGLDVAGLSRSLLARYSDLPSPSSRGVSTRELSG